MLDTTTPTTDAPTTDAPTRPSSTPDGARAGERVVIPVTGMTCAACQARVQRTLSRTPGVADASVNLMMANATVAYDPAATSPQALVDVIRSTGYGAELPTPGRTAFEEQAERDRAQGEEFVTLRRKAIVSAAAGVVAMLLSMPLMAGHGGQPSLGSGQAHRATDPLMDWATGALTPALLRA